MNLTCNSYIQVVEALPTPILLLRNNGLILCANTAAITLLETLDGITPEPEITLVPSWIMEELEA